MAKRSRGIDKLQYGDFQTPIDLARRICAVLSESINAPRTVLEPTCGQGSLLAAAAEAFPRAQRIIGLDRNASYLKQARRRLNAILANARTTNAEVTLCESDFFKTDWQKHRLFFQPPLLVIGNPPWVTNSSLATVESDNLPNKSNINGVRGIDAITGGGNFDISSRKLEILIFVLFMDESQVLRGTFLNYVMLHFALFQLPTYPVMQVMQKNQLLKDLPTQ